MSLFFFASLLQENQGKKESDQQGARELLQEVQGFLVSMPLKFLEQEDLQNQLVHLVVPEIFV